jgi:NTE family protein
MDRDPGNRRRRQWLTAALAAAAALRVAPVAGAKPRRIGVALGSGGLHGYAHLGVVSAFAALGLKPDAIAGTSVGAIVGCLWAAGLDADAIEEFANEPAWREFGELRLPRLGLSELNRLREAIDRRVGGVPIERLKTPFAAVATDIATGAPVVLARGAAGAAVAASAAVPLRFEPVTIDGRRLADGALAAPVPVDAARALGADFVVAADFAYRPYEERVDGMLAMAFQMVHILVNRLIEEQIRRADFAIRQDVHAAMQGPTGVRALREVGERAVRRSWPALQAKLRGPRPT